MAAAEIVARAPACTCRRLDEGQGTGGGMRMAGRKGACIAAALAPGLLEASAGLGAPVVVEPLQAVHPPANYCQVISAGDL